jgi:ketosteroid isomerase-like protein
MADSAVQAAETLYAALEADDIDALLDLCADDVSVDYPAAGELPYGGHWQGRDGLAAFLDTHDQAEEILEFDVDRLLGDEDLVIALGRFSGRAKPSGTDWSTHFAHALTFRDGKLRRWQAYFDTAAALAAHRQDDGTPGQ